MLGQNNLTTGFWEREKKQFIELYRTVGEIFRSAAIIFSLILPRWDSEEIYNTSLIFNSGLEELCKTLPYCYACDFSEDFAYSSDLFKNDGIHLNSEGKFLLAFSLHRYLVERFNTRNKTKTFPVGRIPKELKILHPPRKYKVQKKTMAGNKFGSCDLPKERAAINEVPSY